jgi:hypothetical protein
MLLSVQHKLTTSAQPKLTMSMQLRFFLLYRVTGVGVAAQQLVDALMYRDVLSYTPYLP